MHDLIQMADCRIGADTVQAVNARDLHRFLEVGKRFASWIQERIQQYGFVEHRDFEVLPDSGRNFGREVFARTGENAGPGGFSQNGEKPPGGRPTIEYAITVDMAKELAMVERNEKGKQARAYFIECERQAKAAGGVALNLRDPRQLAAAALQLIEVNQELRAENHALQARVDDMAPKVKYAEAVLDAEGDLSLGDVAKLLGYQVRRFWAVLRVNDVIMKSGAPAAKYATAGYFKLSPVHKNRDGQMVARPSTRVTPLGIEFLRRFAEKHKASIEANKPDGYRDPPPLD